MSLKGINGMRTCLSHSLKLMIKKQISLTFIIGLSLIKLLRIMHFKYIIIPYNRDLKYLCPLNQICDWYHITTEVLLVGKQFKPEDGWIVVDVGANVGLYAMYCAQKVGSKGTVIAIEPDPHNFTRLLYNTMINGFNNVITLNIALADRIGKMNLFKATSTSHSISKNFAFAHTNYAKHSIPFIEVPCETLDKVVCELKISQIDLLNLDVEGAALIILKGAQNALKEKTISRIKIEIENENEVGLLSELLENFSYKVFRRGVSLYALATA